CTETLGGRLTSRGLAAAELKLTYEVEEGQPVAASVVTPAPVDSIELGWAAVLGLLGDLHPPAPVTAVRIEAGRLSPAGGRQTDMWRPGDAARDAVAA